MENFVYYLFFGVIFIVAIGYLFIKKGGLNKMKTHGKNGVLMMYARDLTKEAAEKKLDPIIGRKDEIAQTIQILARRNKNNPVLVGKAGVGKTAIVEGLAHAIVNGDVPNQLKNKKVIALDLSGILAGTKYRGEFEQRLKQISDEIISSNRVIILFIDEIHTLAEAGEAEGAIEASDILKPALARGELQVVGATTLGEYKKYISPDTTLARRFEPVIVEEPSEDQTLEILRGIKGKYEKYHRVKIADESLRYAISEAKNKIPERSFPDKAIDIIDEASARISLKRVEDSNEELIVKKDDIDEVVKERVESIQAGL